MRQSGVSFALAHGRLVRKPGTLAKAHINTKREKVPIQAFVIKRGNRCYGAPAGWISEQNSRKVLEQEDGGQKDKGGACRI